MEGMPIPLEGSDPMAALLMKPDDLQNPLMMGSQPPALEEEDDIDDEDLEESLSERLWGLTEMFPEPVRKVTGGILSFSWNASKTLYSLGCSGMWVVASSAAILALPIMFETERAQMEEQQMQQQRQILLGPNAAVSGAGAIPSGMSPAAMPQVMPGGQR